VCECAHVCVCVCLCMCVCVCVCDLSRRQSVRPMGFGLCGLRVANTPFTCMYVPAHGGDQT